MNTITLNNYPIFVPNQILTDEDLNEVVKYLESLNQFTRTHFIGMGIAYGLEVQRLSPTRIQVTSGCGITSQGFVIQATTTTNSQRIFEYYQETTIAKNLFIPGESSQQSYKVKELVVNSGQTGTNVHQLTEAILNQQVVVVFYDWQDSPRPESCQLNYDAQSGKEREFRLRFLLLPSTQPKDADPSVLSAERLLRVGYQFDQLPEPWKIFEAQSGTAAVFEARNQFFAARDLALQVRRFAYVDVDDAIDLASINSYEAWRENYFKICQGAIAAIDKAFPELFRLFSPFFSSFHPNSKQDFANLAQPLTTWLQRFHPNRPLGVVANNTEPPYALQYFYDYLSQLVAAYSELVETVFDLMDDTTPDMNRFPQFLMLGLVPPMNEPFKGFAIPSAYRNQFVQPRIYSNQHRVQQVRYLYERLLKLCDFQADESFYLLPFYKTPIKITPSKDRSTPLSEQAIPYYLNYPKLYQYWNYDAYRKGRSDRHPAYFYPKKQGESTHVFDELTYRLDAYNFYRIEGHLGRSNADALKGIQDYQQRYNLPFDVITLKLGSLASLNDLNLSAQFDHLNNAFERLKDKFQMLWKTNEAWSSNVLLITLNKVFFSKDRLEDINPDLLINPLLDRAKLSASYEFAQDTSDRQGYHLFLKNAAGRRIGEYIFRSTDKTPKQLSFAGLTENEIAQAKRRIISGLIDALTPDKITYGIDRQSSTSLRFHRRLLSSDRMTLPLDKSGVLTWEEATIELQDSFLVKDRPDLEIAENSCPDVLSLYGLLRDVPDSYAPSNNLRFGIGNSTAAEQIGNAELTNLIEAYQQQLEQVISLHLFNTFAKKHPGIEPLGGVPKGGTFILVYVDGQDVDSLLADEQSQEIYDFRNARTQAIEAVAMLPPATSETEIAPTWEALLQEVRDRRDIVIADFCLPYRSSSRVPAVSYVLARPRPIILLQKTVFCEGDSTSYPFILEPEGGMVKGEGISFDGKQSVFQPSNISNASKEQLNQGKEVALTFSYAVDDTYDTLIVTIHPKPKPELTIGEGQNFCHDGSSTDIELAAGTPENIELVSVKIKGTETRALDTNQYAAAGQPETVMIEAFVRDRETQCTNTIARQVTINPLPEGTLSIQNGQSFCQNADQVEIKLAPGTTTELELVRVTIKEAETRILDPRNYARNGQPETVAIAARIRDKRTQCENTLNYTVTIKPLPNAEFGIGGENITTLWITASSVTLTPSQPGGTFQARIGNQDISARVLDEAEFFPNRVLLDETETEKKVALTYCISQDGCNNQLTKEITVSVQPAIEEINLLTLSPDGDTVSNRIALQNEQTFSLSFFPRANYRFEAQVSGKVHSVIFTYIDPNNRESVMNPVNTAPYRTPERWQPTIGIHTIAAQAFSEIDGEGLAGESRSCKITILNDEVVPSVAAPSLGQVAPPQADSPPNALGINSLFSRVHQANQPPELSEAISNPNSLSSTAENSSTPVSQPAENPLLPHIEPTMTILPINATPSHPDPIPPWSADAQIAKPQRAIPPKLIQVMTVGAIAAFLSLAWAYSTTKLPGTSQPSSPNSIEQSVP